MSLLDYFEIPSRRESYEYELWEKAECYRFYVRERRRNCTFKQIMNLWLRAPYCSTCAISDPFLCERLPDILGRNWKMHVLWNLGETALKLIRQAHRRDSNYALICKKCGHALRPWRNDEVWIMKYHLEEHYGIPIEKSGQKAISKKVRKQIIALYDEACFGCGAKDKLHIDHILPQSKGGASAFRNLQPLCQKCGNLKGDDLPEEVDVYSDIYFGPYPSDGYEGLFW